MVLGRNPPQLRLAQRRSQPVRNPGIRKQQNLPGPSNSQPGLSKSDAYSCPCFPTLCRHFVRPGRHSALRLPLTRFSLSNVTHERWIYFRSSMAGGSDHPLDHVTSAATTMSLKAAHELSIPELLHVLNQKLILEFKRAQQFSLGLSFSASSFENVRARSRVNMAAGHSRFTQIKSLEAGARDTLRLLADLWNQLQPVSRLSPEIMSPISRHEWDTRSIVPLTHVCRYWPESSISAPDNWTSMRNERSRLVALSLERAKTAPLRIHLALDCNPETLHLLASRIGTAKTLHIEGFSTLEEFSQALPNLSLPIPNIRSLALDSSGPTEWDLSVDLFRSPAHTLRHLSLTNIPFFPSFLCLRILTCFSLTDHTFRLPLDYFFFFLLFLEGNPSPEDVRLEFGFARPTLRHSGNQNVIKSQIRFPMISSCNSLDIKALISRMALPGGAHLDIRPWGANVGLNDILSDNSVTHLQNLSSPLS